MKILVVSAFLFCEKECFHTPQKGRATDDQMGLCDKSVMEFFLLK